MIDPGRFFRPIEFERFLRAAVPTAETVTISHSPFELSHNIALKTTDSPRVFTACLREKELKNGHDRFWREWNAALESLRDNWRTCTSRSWEDPIV